MDQSILSSRAVIGRYYALREASAGLPWVDGVSNFFTSDQKSEDYAFLGMSPAYREWVGGRQAKGLRQNTFSIANVHYEKALQFRLVDLRRDKTRQIDVRLQEFIGGEDTHWASLLTTLMMNGTSTVCYDGQFFFDTDHSEGDSGTQDNDITVDISALPATLHGSVTSPSKEEFQQSIIKGIAQILGFKDDQGEPMNEDAKEFLVIVPLALFIAATAAVADIVNAALANNMNPNLIAGLTVRVQMNPRLTWTDSFAVFRTDSPVKAFIRQSETEPTLKAKAEGSDFEYDNDAWEFGLDRWCNVGYGLWQRSCYVTMT